MKVLYCISGTYNSGGMERVLSNKANYLVTHGYDVTIVTTDQRGRQPFFKLDSKIRCIDLNVNYEINNGKSFFNKLIHYPFKQVKHRARLTKIINEIKPDITISMFCNEASFLPQIKDGSKKVLEVHFSRFKRLQYDRKGLWRLTDKWRNQNDLKIASRYDRFVVLTYEDSQYWNKLQNISVIPNAQTFTCSSAAKLENKEVIAVGRYTYQKGYDLLLQAWSLIVPKVQDWRLRIVGDGELKEELSTFCKKLNIERNVVFSPATTNIKDIYSNASILVLSSRYEGFGMVILEAQTMGLPVVSFNCKCGPAEIIENDITGYLVKENDIQGLAENILLLIKDENLRKRMGQKAFIESSRFSEDTIMNKWISLFESLVSNK